MKTSEERFCQEQKPVAYGYWNERLGWYGLSLQPGGSYTAPDMRPLYADPPRCKCTTEKVD
jgi:hypothetical protein